MGRLRSREVVAVCITAATLLVACGDDKPSVSPTTVPTTTATTISQAEADRQKAQRVVLTAADVPGFTEDAPKRGGKDNADLEAAANACVDDNPLLVRLGEDDDPRGAGSPNFRKGDAAGIGNDVTFGENEDEARSAIAALGASTFPGCFSNALATELRKDPTLTNVGVTTAHLPGLTVGDQSLGYRSVARARVKGTPLTFNFDFTFIRSGRGVAVLSDFAVNGTFPEPDRARLATTIADRMAGP